ncbi:MAG: hypothetical protein JJU36_10555 [Phycisphaeraceae bacterium]|nr:hypothetical protein [Phycisphaeraceae bacterium]
MIEGDSRIDLLVIASMARELGPVASRLGWSRPPEGARIVRASAMGDSRSACHRLSGRWKESRIALVVTGIGRGSVDGLLPRLLRGLSPRGVLLVGLSGGLNPRLDGGEARRIDRAMAGGRPMLLLGEDGSVRESPNERSESWSAEAVSVLTVDRPSMTLADKSAHHHATGADLIDMETYHVAWHALRQGVAFWCFRGVSDPADAGLPAGLLHHVGPDGRVNVTGFLGWLVCNPREWGTLWRLGRDSRRAVASVAGMVEAWAGNQPWLSVGSGRTSALD